MQENNIYDDYKKQIIREFNENCQKIKKEENMPKKNKLTPEQIEEIKSRKGEFLSDLAREFNVSYQTISYHQKKVKSENGKNHKSKHVIKQKGVKLTKEISGNHIKITVSIEI